MSIFRFDKEDTLFNTIKAYPDNEFFIYSASVYYQNQNAISGAHVANLYDIPVGYTSLYQINVDRENADTGLIIGPSSSLLDGGTNVKNFGIVYPYVIKGQESLLTDPVFKGVTSDTYKKTQPGVILTGSYDISASIAREEFAANHLATLESDNANTINSNRDKAVTDFQNAQTIRPLISASALKVLEATLDYNSIRSPHFFYSASIKDGPNRSFDVVRSTLVSIPSIFYGSEIKPGSVKLDYYITGTYIGSLVDKKHNGELIQVSSSFASDQNDTVAGIVLYREGFLILSGAYDLATGTESRQTVSDGNSLPKWIHWGNSITTPADQVGSYRLTFQGTKYTHTNTYFASMEKGQLNWSNNPTFLEPSSAQGLGFATGSTFAFESERVINNVVSSSFANVSASFKKTTYVNRVNLYGEDGRLVAVGKLAQPFRKDEDRSYTIKLKVDM
jgi:hypothetical protein